MDAPTTSTSTFLPNATGQPAGNATGGRSKLEMMRKQFASKQANRIIGNADQHIARNSGAPDFEKNAGDKNASPEKNKKSPNSKYLAPPASRQILRSVISKEMRAENQTVDKNGKIEESSIQVVENATSSSVSSSHLDSRIAESDIRERLKKQSRRPIHRGAMTYRLRDHEKHSQIPDQSSSNENILGRIRAKGPLIVKNTAGVSADDKGKDVPKTNAIPQARTVRSSSPKAGVVHATTNGRSSPKSKRMPSPVSRGQIRGRNPSPKGRNASPLNRPPSPNTDGISPYSPEDTQKKVARVMKARLYLLQQNGPNSFRIGGDSPEHKFRVIVGPQTCSCGRSFCVHILFVMLRVFQLDPSSPLLWRKKLKNFEVESLFRDYHERCNSRISPKRKSRVKRMVSQISHGNQQQDTSSNSDDHSSKGEEENCPICLLQMVDDEPITVCEVGCRNKLHTHCVDIWAEECRRNRDALKCPLCRVVWKPAETSRRPFIVEVPREYEDIADSWARSFGWELVSCLFSTHPNVRENGLRRLSHDITGALLLNSQPADIPDDNSDDSDRSSPRGATANPEMSRLSSNASLSACCSILATVCSDPDYRVYITALRTLRAMLAYTQCQTSSDVQAFQNLLSPVIETILLKCADSSRRALQLSVSTIMELCRGQTGELAVGKEIAAESLAIGDVDYVLNFLDSGHSPDSSSWQWMLGRLNVLNDLFKDFKAKFMSRQSSDLSYETAREAWLLRIARFTSNCLRVSKHQNVVKMAHKVFVQAVNHGSYDHHFITECMQMLQNLDQPRLRKRVAQFLPDQQETNSQWDEDQADGEDVMPLVPVKSPVAVSETSHAVADIRIAASASTNFPTYTVMSQRTMYPMPQFAGPVECFSPPNHEPCVGDFEDELAHVDIDDSHMSCLHPPTPPPSSDDTAILTDAIQVSLFRPIQCLSPQNDVPSVTSFHQPVLDGREKAVQTGQSHAGLNNDSMAIFSNKVPINPQVVQNSTHQDPAVGETSKSAPVTPASPDKQMMIEARRQRPTLLRLRSESSAFRQARGMASMKKVATPESEQSLSSPSGRDRSSSRESDSSASQDGLFRGSERRMSVRELAESINRKHGRPHAPHMKKEIHSPGYIHQQPRAPATANADRALELPESPVKQCNPMSSQATRISAEAADAKLTPKRPLLLPKYDSHPISRSVARRGTMERYKERKRLEKLANPPQTVEEHAAGVADHDHVVTHEDTKKANPPLNVYSRSNEQSPNRSRLPMRGILKNTSNEKRANVPSAVLAPQRQKSTATDSARNSTSSTDYLSEDKDSATASSPCKSSEEFGSVFAGPQEDLLPRHNSEDDILHGKSEIAAGDLRSQAESESDSDYFGSEKKFENARDSIIDLHGNFAAGGSGAGSSRPTRPKQLKRNGAAKSPTRDTQRNRLLSPTSSGQIGPVKHVTESVPSKSGKESLFYIRTVRKDENSPGTSKQRILPPLPPKESRNSSKEAISIKTSSEQYDGGKDVLTVEDLESDTSQAEKTPVTFKTEIGDDTAPLEDISNTADFSSIVGSDYAADITHACSCQAQIAEEESKLFARALAISYVQDALPTIPHLTYSDEDATIVRTQDENTDAAHEYRLNQHWLKGHQIGLGALSSCFQSRDVFTGTLMAVKQVNYQRCSEREQHQVLDVIEKEIEMMRHLSHPNIVRLHGTTIEMGMYNIFFEWCAGGSVSTLLSKYGPFTESVISNYTLQILRGLSYLHERHIIHRDIKGANLLVDSTGQRLRIGDFGAAARLATKCTGAGEFKGQLLGTIAFMAPEVLRGEHYGRSCDIWGCGCVITEMATGKPPWEADQHSNHLSLIFKIASSSSMPIIPDNLSPAMRDLCRRCLETNPAERPPADDLLKHPVFIRW